MTMEVYKQQQVDHAAGGPHHLQVVLEGESLLNDATSITLFLVFLKEVQDLQSQTNPPKVGAHEFGVIVGNIIWLSVGECCVFACAQLPNNTLSTVEAELSHAAAHILLCLAPKLYTICV
jgi:NhaP-type Na+/H+ or K+/H+ antiporter